MNRIKRIFKRKEQVKRKEQEKTAVAGTVMAPLAPWRRFFRPKTLIFAICALLIIVLAVIVFKLYATVTQDLVLVLTPGEAALSLVHDETQEITFAARTNSFLFCEAECSAELRDISHNTVIDEKSLDENVTFSFTAPDKGEGQMIYGVTVTCANIERKLCARSGDKHRASVLITVDYTWPEEEKEAQALAVQGLRKHLAQLTILDSNTQTLLHQVAELQRGEELPLSGLESAASSLEKERATAMKRAEHLRELWNQEEYESLNSELPQGFGAIAEESDAALADVQTYVVAQKQLARQLRAAVSNISQLDAAHRVFTAMNADGLVRRAEEAVAEFKRIATGVARQPTRDVLERSGNLTAFGTEQAALVVNGALLLSEETAAVEKLILLEEERLANVNATMININNTDETNETNITTVTETAPADDTALVAEKSASANISFDDQHLEFRVRCEELAALNARLAEANLTATAETATMLVRCTAINDINATIVPHSLYELRFEEVELSPFTATSSMATEVDLKPPQCCAFNNCSSCCDEESCRRTPVIFLHGHSMYSRNAPEYSLEAFSQIQKQLQNDSLFIDGGVLTPHSSYVPMTKGIWGRSPAPATVSGTYYYDAYLSGQSYILSAAKSESIDTYAIRVKDLVETLRTRTGSEKVIIVAHSMGGLVARRYLQLFGEEHVAKLVLVGTPNHGVNNSVATICPIFGADKECEELNAGSTMLAKLNDPSKLPKIPVMVIIGKGCDTSGKEGDGVVTAESAQLDWAENIEVNGSCTSFETWHTAMLDPKRHPEVYQIIRKEIRG